MFILLILGIIFLDQITKILAAAFNCDVTLIKNIFSFNYMQNSGGAFSFLSDANWAMGLFIALTCIAVLVMSWIFFNTKSRFLKLGLAFLIAGALGNLIDRIAFSYVRDFIFVHFFANFNVADIAVTAGVVLVIIYLLYISEDSLFKKKKTEEKPESEKIADEDAKN